MHTIRTEHDYDKAVEALNQLLDAGANEEHALADLAHKLGALISEYDDVHYPVYTVKS